MKRAVFLRLGLLIAVALAAQDLLKDVIAGTVVNEVTGQPIRRASVVLSGSEEGRRVTPAAAETGANGVFRFEGLRVIADLLRSAELP